MSTPSSTDKNHDIFPELPTVENLPAENLPANIDRRSFIVRNAVIGAAAVMTGRVWTTEARAAQAAKEAVAPKLGANLSPTLDIVRQSKGPVMTILEEFY